MIRGPTPLLLYGSLLLGVVFAIIPLPAGIDEARPYLLALLLAYWLLEAPSYVGLGTALCVGLLADLTTASLLGEQAFRLVVLTFLVQRFRARLRFFPFGQQSMAVGLLLFNDRIIVALIHAIASMAQPSLYSWSAPLLGMALWPWLFVLLDRVRLRAREHT